jgi:hypothetical protein
MQVKWVGAAVVLCCAVCCAGCCPLSTPAHANEAVVYNKVDCLGFLGSSPESVIQQYHEIIERAAMLPYNAGEVGGLSQVL